MIVSLYFGASTEKRVVPKNRVSNVAKDELVVKKPVVPRRLPLAGAEGYFVVLMPDGTSYLESPNGQKTSLVDKRFASIPSELALNAQIAKQLQQRQKQQAIIKPPETRLGQLVVLDEGVVDVPEGAIITFVGPDRLVATSNNGTSTVYYANGRVEVRNRADLLDSVSVDTPYKQQGKNEKGTSTNGK
jgi:hypothetical protein